MANVNFHKIKKVAVGQQLTKIKGAYIWDGTDFVRVWSGASQVSYYDGNTLLGTIEVDEGEDVLHPSLDTTKSGYTLYGWATSKSSNNRVELLTATGDPIALYAIYLPNTIVVATGTVTNSSGWVNYIAGQVNSAYVSGGLAASAQRAAYYGGAGSAEGSAVFTVTLGRYQNGTIKWSYATGNGDNQVGKVDGIEVSSGYGSKSINASGSHTLYTKGTASDGSWTSTVVGITNITLSNPIAWE